MTDLARPSFAPDFTNWLATAPMADIEEAYCESYKDAHGIKARWVYGKGYSREHFADSFEILGRDIKAACERQDAEDAAFRERVASLGLTEWCERNNIRTELDLMEYNYQNSREF